MVWWAKQLTKPLDYLSIRIGDSGEANPLRMYNFVLPGLGAVVCALSFHFFAPNTSLIGDDGLFRHLLSLSQVLVPFYIAALAAVASMGGTWLDGEMRGTRPTTLHGQNVKRREYVVRMFGYLAYVTLCMFIAIVSIIVLGPGIYERIHVCAQPFVRSITLFSILCVFFNVTITTLLSLHFLSDRLHEPEA